MKWPQLRGVDRSLCACSRDSDRSVRGSPGLFFALAAYLIPISSLLPGRAGREPGLLPGSSPFTTVRGTDQPAILSCATCVDDATNSLARCGASVTDPFLIPPNSALADFRCSWPERNACSSAATKRQRLLRKAMT
jgi:hypothetical protein